MEIIEINYRKPTLSSDLHCGGKFDLEHIKFDSFLKVMDKLDELSNKWSDVWGQNPIDVTRQESKVSELMWHECVLRK